MLGLGLSLAARIFIPPATGTSAMLKEDSGFLLLEDGSSKILL